MLVMTPTGISPVGKSSRAKVSLPNRRKEPKRQVGMSILLCFGPSTRRAIWGAIRPMNPITPKNETQVATAKVASNRNIIRIFWTGRPDARADPSSRSNMSISVWLNRIGSMNRRAHSIMNSTCCHVLDVKLPRVQKRMRSYCSWLRNISSVMPAERI